MAEKEAKETKKHKNQKMTAYVKAVPRNSFFENQKKRLLPSMFLDQEFWTDRHFFFENFVAHAS